MTDTMREAFERDMNPPSIWEELLSWNEAFDDYSKGYQAAQADARALVGECLVALNTCKLFAGCEREYDEQIVDDAKTKAQAFMEGK